MNSTSFSVPNSPFPLALVNKDRGRSPSNEFGNTTKDGKKKW
jgi:hypothetical protein